MVCVCVFVCMCVYACVSVCVCMYLYMCVYVRCMQVHICVQEGGGPRTTMAVVLVPFTLFFCVVQGLSVAWFLPSGLG